MIGDPSENSLHWVRDVTYREDRSKARTGNADHTMASIRNLAISIHRLAGDGNHGRVVRVLMGVYSGDHQRLIRHVYFPSIVVEDGRCRPAGQTRR